MTNNSNENEHLLPCIVQIGTLYTTKDMLKALEDLYFVRYEYINHGNTISTGEGFIMSVISNKAGESTLVFNKRLYLNLASFEYLEVSTVSEDITYFNLIANKMVLRLISDANLDAYKTTTQDNTQGNNNYKKVPFRPLPQSAEPFIIDDGTWIDDDDE